MSSFIPFQIHNMSNFNNIQCHMLIIPHNVKFQQLDKSSNYMSYLNNINKYIKTACLLNESELFVCYLGNRF